MFTTYRGRRGYYNGRVLSRTTLAGQTFGPEITAYDLLAGDRDERPRSARTGGVQMTRRRRQGRDGQDRVAELEPLSAQLSTIRFGRADGLPWGCRPEGGFLDEVTARRMLRHADVIGAKTVPAGQAHARSSPAG